MVGLIAHQIFLKSAIHTFITILPLYALLPLVGTFFTLQLIGSSILIGKDTYATPFFFFNFYFLEYVVTAIYVMRYVLE